MEREKGKEIPIWNLTVNRCGPDPNCTHYKNHVCHFVELGENIGKLVCPNPQCEKRRITGYKPIKSPVMS